VCVLAAGPAAGASVITLQSGMPGTVARYSRGQIAFSLDRDYANPYDPAEVDARAVFTAPSGRRIVAYAFAARTYANADIEGRATSAAPVGGMTWRVRFAPAEVGRYRVALEVVDAAGKATLDLPAFECVESSDRGFIRATAGSNGRAVYDSGGMFLPIGECLWMPRSLDQFRREFDLYAQHGMNYFRFFTSHDSMFFFESARQPTGQYDQLALSRLDRLFEEVSARGLAVMPCLEMFADFRVTQPYPYWDENPYNRRNGGPCAKVSDFFTSPEARRLYRNKLRYFSARYGAYSALFCVQLFAEANYTENYDMAAVRSWHKEMAGYLRSIDPYRHPISTSMAAWDSQDKELFALPELDLVLNEVYNACDFAAELSQDNAEILTRYRKPVFLAETGITFEYFVANDPAGVHIHNGLWANPMSGAVGAPSFWWTSYIRERNLLPHFGAFARFMDGEDLVGLRPVWPRVSVKRDESVHPDLILTFPYQDPPGAKGPQTVELRNDRHLTAEIPNLPRNLYGRTGPDGRPSSAYNPLTLVTDFAADGAINIHPRWVGAPASAEAELHVTIDGVPAKVIRYTGCAMDDWSAFLAKSKEVCVVTSVPVSKGRHRIVLDNRGNLFVSAALDLTNYLKSSVPNLRVLGMGNSRRALLWLQNRDNTWWRNAQGKRPRKLSGAQVSLPGMEPGAYEVEWWDTYTGAAVRRRRLTCTAGVLRIPVEPLETDTACKVRRVGEAP
jgi:hypothetical protein